ncbi:MAG: type II toxin-antitoxin system VapC family toxin, partial [Terriglobales bacterium]
LGQGLPGGAAAAARAALTGAGPRTMTAALLLDTHIALWLDSGDPRLRPATIQLIDELRQAGGVVYLSAVSAWEIALLVDTGRIDLDLPVEAWLARFVAQPGVEGLPLSLGAAAAAYRLHAFPHRDPGDRLLMAAAIEIGCPLVSYDTRITQFARRHGSQLRLAVSA